MRQPDVGDGYNDNKHCYNRLLEHVKSIYSPLDFARNDIPNPLERKGKSRWKLKRMLLAILII
jgi:hypothetical protein